MRGRQYYFHEECYPLLNKDYREALEKVELSLHRVLLYHFSKKYLLPSKGWKEKIEAASSVKAKENVKLALNDFCYSIQALKRFEIKLISDKTYIRYADDKPTYSEFKFTYPHANIRQEFMEYEKSSPSFLPTKLSKTVDKMEALYIKISAAYKNLEEWLNCLKEYGEEDFVWQNVEYRIGQELCNKDLWNLYFRYLENHNPEGLPRALSAYCRFWVDDEKMNQRFKEAAEKFPNWKDYFPFKERIVENVDGKPSRKRPNPNIISKRPLKRAKLSVLDSKKVQRLALPESMIFPIFKRTDPSLLSKLQKSSKYCYGRLPNPICHRAWITDDHKYRTGFYKDTLSVQVNKSNLTKVISKLYIGTRLEFNVPDKLALSKILKTTIYKCEAKYIHIANQDLTKAEFEFLAKPERVEELVLMDCSIKSENGDLMTIDEILAMVPNIRSFETNSTLISSPTALADMKLSKKLLNFKLLSKLSAKIVDFQSLSTFISKKGGPCSYFEINFKHDGNDPVDRQRCDKFYNQMRRKFKKWIPYDDHPKLLSNHSRIWDVFGL